MAGLANEAHQRGLKDFLQLYNTITEYCFTSCVSNFNERFPSQPEDLCINNCTNNYVKYNQRFMFNFMNHQERRKREAEATAQAMTAKDQQLMTDKQVKQAARVIEAMSGSDPSKFLTMNTDVLSTTSSTQNQSVTPDVTSEETSGETSGVTPLINPALSLDQNSSVSTSEP